MQGRHPSRRAWLRGVAAAAAGGLAGCSLGGGDGGDGGGDGDGGGGGTEPTAGRTATPDGAGPVRLHPVATGLDAPLDLAVGPAADRRYVADQTGVVLGVDDDGVEPVLDLRDRIVGGGERGLLGLALHPRFAENRRLFVRYSAPRAPGTPAAYDHTFVLAEFRANGAGTRVDPASERRLLLIPEPQSNHNAGSIAFGPDGSLYVGVGDGGAGGDRGLGHVEGGNGQDVRENLLGAILRIDVDGGTAERPYAVPDDNPLVGETGLDEHWAWGFRNPWRFSFDGEALYVGDVGQSDYEEVDRVERGGNYGWNVWEGAHCYGADTCPTETPDGEPFRPPVVEYPHGDAPVSGRSVIGGYVARGGALAGLDGRYVFGDLNPRGRLFVADPTDGEGPWSTTPLPIAAADRDRLARLLSFGRAPDGTLYALGTGSAGGGVYELRRSG